MSPNDPGSEVPFMPTADVHLAATATWMDDDSLRVSEPSQRALIRVLSFAHSNRIVPAAMVESLSREFSGKKARSLQQVAELLAADVPVVDALEQTPGAMQPVSLLALRLASETGTTSQMYEALLRSEPDSRLQPDHELQPTGVELLQLAAGFLFAWTVLSFLLVFIVPTFEKMFDEFGLSLPSPMLLLIGISRQVGGFSFVFGLFLLVCFAVVWFWIKGRQWRPWTASYVNVSSLASLPALLAIIVRSGRPLPSGVATLSRFYPSSRIRNRLVNANRAIEQGEQAWRALYQQRLIRRPIADALMMAPDRATETWLLQQATFARRHRDNFYSDGLIRLVFFVGIFLLAIIVCFAAVAVFATLYDMVGALS